ncbi:MAG: HK97-gp10 family putative phage morphogenesis protein [Candidatus Coproplasma sp.]
MAKKYRGSSIKRKNIVEMYGVSDLLKKIEAAGGKVDEAVKKAVDASLEQVGMKMQLFMLGHKESGETYQSYEQIMASIKDNKVEAMVGYNVKNGGLPAIFLDVGTPKQKPHFFRYYAVENSRKQIDEIQRATLNEILEGLK